MIDVLILLGVILIIALAFYGMSNMRAALREVSEGLRRQHNVITQGVADILKAINEMGDDEEVQDGRPDPFDVIHVKLDAMIEQLDNNTDAVDQVNSGIGVAIQAITERRKQESAETEKKTAEKPKTPTRRRKTT